MTDPSVRHDTIAVVPTDQTAAFDGLDNSAARRHDTEEILDAPGAAPAGRGAEA